MCAHSYIAYENTFMSTNSAEKPKTDFHVKGVISNHLMEVQKLFTQPLLLMVPIGDQLSPQHW